MVKYQYLFCYWSWIVTEWTVGTTMRMISFGSNLGRVNLSWVLHLMISIFVLIVLFSIQNFYRKGFFYPFLQKSLSDKQTLWTIEHVGQAGNINLISVLSANAPSEYVRTLWYTKQKNNLLAGIAKYYN